MQLTCLILHEPSYRDKVRLNLNDSLIIHFRSATLLHWKLNMQPFYDCLCVLDGLFDQLRTFIVNLVNLVTDEVENQVRSL